MRPSSLFKSEMSQHKQSHSVSGSRTKYLLAFRETGSQTERLFVSSQVNAGALVFRRFAICTDLKAEVNRAGLALLKCLF